MELKNITEVAKICDKREFEALCKKEPEWLMLNKEWVFLKHKQTMYEVHGAVTTGLPLPKESIAIMPTGCSAGYISFLVNTMMVQAMLLGDDFRITKHGWLAKKRLCDLSLFVLDFEEEIGYILADKIRLSAFERFLQDRKNELYKRVYLEMFKLCDMMAFELYANPLFKEHGVNLNYVWGETIVATNCSVPEIFNALMNKSHPLGQELMRAQKVMSDAYLSIGGVFGTIL